MIGFVAMRSSGVDARRKTPASPSRSPAIAGPFEAVVPTVRPPLCGMSRFRGNATSAPRAKRSLRDCAGRLAYARGLRSRSILVALATATVASGGARHPHSGDVPAVMIRYAGRSAGSARRGGGRCRERRRSRGSVSAGEGQAPSSGLMSVPGVAISSIPSRTSEGRRVRAAGS